MLLFKLNNLIQIQMQINPGHQPKRFEEYIELEDGTGFTLKGSEHVFLYDQYGGWKDEYGNYYNENGDPAEQDEDENSERSISQGSWNEDEDEFEKQFGPNSQVQKEFENQPVQSAEQLTIGRNIELLEEHIKKDPLRVNFEIVDLEPEDELPTQKEILIEYRKKVNGLINVFIESNSGEGYFVVSNVPQAIKLINLEGENIIGFDLSFDVESFDELRNDPLSQEERETKIPQFVTVDKNQKVYTIHLDDHAGFGDKKLYKEWEKKVKSEVTKFQIIKMRTNEKKQKVPVVKASQNDLDKIKSILYDGKVVVIEQYQPIQKVQFKVKQQEPVQKQAEQKVQKTQKTQSQKKQEETTQTTQESTEEKTK